ncbi:hypothetical protein SUDANB176_00346 [Streptomyces sp. enrichment culture]|uniref:hypothetical protein n=1 Tax=Streptomyces sp. enrichment culture TaxID=1795815 RepID=UPI003F54ED50
MTQQGIVAIEHMDGPAAAQAEDAFRLIRAEAFAEPPYYETEDDVAAAFRRFPSQVRRHTFRAALARCEDGEPVGMAYGWSLAPDTGWWDEPTEPVPEDMRREDGHRTFGLMELAVRGPWRGQGIARWLKAARERWGGGGGRPVGFGETIRKRRSTGERTAHRLRTSGPWPRGTPDGPASSRAPSPPPRSGSGFAHDPPDGTRR